MKEHIKRVDRILKYKGSILDIYTDVIETPDGHRAEWDYIDHRVVLMAGMSRQLMRLQENLKKRPDTGQIILPSLYQL